MRILFVVFSIVFFTFNVSAQTDYSFCKEQKILSSTNTLFRTSAATAINPDTAELIRIPVVFNIVNLGEPIGIGTNISDTIVRNALQQVNDFYRNRYLNDPRFSFQNSKGLDTKVEFYLADLDVNCSYSTGIRRYNGSNIERYSDIGITYDNTSDGFNNDLTVKSLSGTSPTRYLNIYIVNNIYSTDGTVQGYAFMPPSYGVTSGFGIVALWNNINGVLIHEIAHFLNLTHEDMAVDGISGPWAYPIIRSSAHFYKERTLGSPFSCIPTVQNDLAVQNLSGIKDAQCKTALQPKVKVKNYGSNTITSCKIKMLGNNQVLSDYTWTGSLATMDTTWITLPSINPAAGSYLIKAIIYQVNGTAGTVAANDTVKVNTRIVDFLGAIPYSNDMNSSVNPLVISSSNKSKVSVQSGIGFNNTPGLLFEGYNHSFEDGVPPPNEFDVFEPYKIQNVQYFSYAEMCINTTPGKHYKVKYKRFQDAWNSSNFRCLANNVEMKNSSNQRTAEWVTDSTVVSSNNNTTILLTFQAACSQSYETRIENTNGDYIIMDNLRIEEVASTPYVMNVSVIGKTTGCSPFSVNVHDNSYGAPLPVSYDIYAFKNNIPYDSLKNTSGIEYFGMYVNEQAEYKLKIVAKFADDHKQVVEFPSFVNTKDVIVTSRSSVSFENNNSLYAYDNYYYPILDWRLSDKGAYGTSDHSMMVRQIGQSYYYTNMITTLESGSYDFSDFNNFTLSFDRAYAIQSEVFGKFEYLSIKYSTDCGNNWVELYKKTGDQLFTTPYDTKYSSSLFVPSPEEWATDKINYNALAGKKKVMFRFDFSPSFGNAIYLDNIIFEDPLATTPTSVSQGSIKKNNLIVYPNPSSTQLTVNSDSGADIVTVQLFDMHGRLAYESNTLDAISVVTLNPGMYIGIAIDREGTRHSFKFVRAAE